MSLLHDPRPVFAHLSHLTDEQGLFEHALIDTPRREHGYCVDDVARGLVVVCREPTPDGELKRLAAVYLNFVLAAIEPDGRCRNRMDAKGSWTDQPSLGDWWGRALWGLGYAAASAPTPGMRARALSGFRIAAQRRSPHLHAMAFAALGAAELLRQRPDEHSARALLSDVGPAIGPRGSSTSWPWPEPRLTYANAAIAEAIIAGGDATMDRLALERGLQLLAFLVKLETRDGHLSVTPVGGRGPFEHGPGFDQQPIEVAALADACATAYRITGEHRWVEAIRLAWGWFLGDNDSRTPMFDVMTGAGYDGLEADGCNFNQGAESTLAMLMTAQHARNHIGAL